jgi:hypothetical protein
MTLPRLPSLALPALAALASAASTGCSTLSPPFDQMKGAQMNLFRLQNYSPPAPQAAASAMPFPIPPQIQQWISAGASLLPPGLLPPGLIPGSTPPPTTNAQRFPPEMGAQGFPIIAWQPVGDQAIANSILETLGHPGNFTASTQNCMYAELGISIIQQGNPTPSNVLVSLSCAQVQATDFQWPYPQTGLTPDTQKRFATITQQVFGGR